MKFFTRHDFLTKSRLFLNFLTKSRLFLTKSNLFDLVKSLVKSRDEVTKSVSQSRVKTLT